jgi:hypothetical protein
MRFCDAISQNHCRLGVRRGDRFIDICTQLGRPCADWLLTRFSTWPALLAAAVFLTVAPHREADVHRRGANRRACIGGANKYLIEAQKNIPCRQRRYQACKKPLIANRPTLAK